MERLEEGPQPAGDLIRIGEKFGYTPKILRDAGERFNMERYKDKWITGCGNYLILNIKVMIKHPNK